MGTKCSLITMYNDKEIAQGFQENLATQQQIDYELVPIDNFNGQYSSIREAYNEAFSKTCGEYVVFLHPDIRFLDAHTLADLMKECDALTDFGVVGIAGAAAGAKGDRIIYTSIVHGEEKLLPDFSQVIHNAHEVQTVDECLFVIKREVFEQNPFIKEEGFHWYAVEYCLNMILAGKKNYAVPAKIWHMSSGKSMDPSYAVYLQKMIKRYGKDFDVIYTTIKKWPTRGLLPYIYRKYYYVKKVLERKMR